MVAIQRVLPFASIFFSRLSCAATSNATASTTKIATSTGSVAVVSPTVLLATTNTTNPSNTTIASYRSTILIIARDAASGLSASSGLNGYGIPFQTLIVPQTGVALPVLNTSGVGNYGGIIVASAVSYDYGTGTGPNGGTGYQSALAADQWNQLYAYQLASGVRMVQYDVYPGPLYGTNALGGCCNTGVEQLISFSSTSAFSQAGIKTGAGVTTQGLYHYPASITNTTTTTEIAQFAANANFGAVSTAAVINNLSGVQQMVFFISWATDWSPTSAYLQHAYITWMTRSLYAGYRRVNLGTQVDDMFLQTDMYSPNGTTFRVRTADMTAVTSWIPSINAKMNSGSNYFPETGFNCNGAIEAAEDTTNGNAVCTPGSIEYADQIDTPLEFQKPLGSGTNQWPATPAAYNYSTNCLKLDTLEQWWTNTANRDKWGLISHTFTHLEVNNATYADVVKEISFNAAAMKQIGLSAGAHYTGNGLIPPAITGLHNGDALRGWHDQGLTHCVGDNTRPVLRNTANDMYPYLTKLAANGYDGFEVIPRWATRIYYNCDLADCTTLEWQVTSAGVGTFDTLIATEKSDTIRHLMGLYHDPYMFHQANLRQTDVPSYTINGVSAKLSLLQIWVETDRARIRPPGQLAHYHSQTSGSRMARDTCGYNIALKSSNSKITGLTVTTNSNTCSQPIPITFPNPPTSTQGYTQEKVGNDPLTLWVTMKGTPVTFTLSTPIPW